MLSFSDTTVGIDIGTDSVKVVQAKKSLTGISIKEAVRLKIPYDHQGNSKTQDIISLLRETLSQYEDQEIVVSLSHDLLFIKTIPLTQVKNSSQIKEKIEKEIKNSFPKGQDELITEHILRNKRSKDKQNVLCIGIEKTFYAKHKEILEFLETKANHLTVETVAIGQAFEYLKKVSPQFKDKHNVAIIDIGASKTTIIIISGNELTFSRIIPASGIFSLTKNLSSRSGISFKEAELLRRSDIIDENTKATIKEYVENLGQEIKYSLGAFNNTSSAKVEKIIISGGGSNLQNLSNDLEYCLGLPVENLSLPPKIFKKSKAIKDAYSFFLISLGLSLNGINSMSFPFSLNQAKPKNKFLEHSFIYSAAALATVIVLFSLNLHLSLLNKEKYNSHLNNKLNHILKNTFKIKRIVEPYSQMKQKFNLSHRIRSPLLSLNILKEIYKKVPEESGVILNRVAIKNGKIYLKGSITSYKILNKFKKNIKDSSWFEDITFRTSQESRDRINFFMNISIKN